MISGRARGDPGFVVPVADGVAAGERAVEVDAPARDFASKAVADRARGFEHDQRIDAAARARAHGCGDGAVGVGESGESRQRAGLGAEQRRAQRLVLTADELRFRLRRRCRGRAATLRGARGTRSG